MRWDWVDDTSGDLRREQKYRRKLRRQQMIAEADAMLDEAEMEEADNTAESAPAVNEQDDEAVLGIDDDDYVEYENMDEDSSDDSEDADSSDDDSISEESAASDEHAYAWGDHVNSRNRFIFNDSDSSDSDDDASDEHVDERLGRPRRSQFTRATRNLLHFRFLRSH